MPLPSSIWNQGRQNSEPPLRLYGGRQPDSCVARWADKQLYRNRGNHLTRALHTCVVTLGLLFACTHHMTTGSLQSASGCLPSDLTWISVPSCVTLARFSDYRRCVTIRIDGIRQSFVRAPLRYDLLSLMWLQSKTATPPRTPRWICGAAAG